MSQSQEHTPKLSESDLRLRDAAQATAWTLRGIGMYGSDVEVVSLDAYKALAARCENAEHTLMMWARKAIELEGRPLEQLREFDEKALGLIADMLRLPVGAVLDALASRQALHDAGGEE